MRKESFTYDDITRRASIEFTLVQSLDVNGVLFEGSIHNEKILFSIDKEKNFCVNGEIEPYGIWTNRLLYYVHFMYPYTFVDTNNSAR